MPDDKLEIPDVPSLTGNDQSDDELDASLQALADSELDPPEVENIGDPREANTPPEGDDPPASENTEEDPLAEPASTEGEEEEPLFADDASDEDKIKAISEKYGGDVGQASKAYLHSQRQNTSLSLENKELKDFISSELEKRIPGQEPTESSTDPKPEEISDEDMATLWLTDPAKANKIVNDRAEKIAREAAQNEFNSAKQTRLVEEAETHTNNLLFNRAKTHLLKVAEMAQDKDGVQKFQDKSYMPTEQEMAVIMPQLGAGS